MAPGSMVEVSRAGLWLLVLLPALVACPSAEPLDPQCDVSADCGPRELCVDRACITDDSLPPGEGEGEGEPGDCPTAAPELDGPATPVEQSVSLEDAGGTGRALGLTLLLPEGVAAAPVLILHPGFQLGGEQYRSYAEHLATRGIAAVLLEPPYALFGGPTHVELADMMSGVLDWLETESAVGGSLQGAVDPARVVLAGHSLGGKIAMLTAARDARALGVFGIDPVDAAGGPGSSPSPDNPSVAPELMGEILVPVAVVGETTNATCSGFLCQACAPAEENFQQYYGAASAPSWQAEVLGANHMSFLDDPDCGFTCNACDAGTDDPTETRRLTRRWLTAFVEHRMGDECARAWLVGEAMQAEVDSGAVTFATANGF